jgi:glutathione S-transferase
VTDLLLFHQPGGCSRITLAALEHAGASYEDRLVDLARGEQHSPEYLAINPRGKIPALVVDGELLAENAAILLWIHRCWPDAGLLPDAQGLAATRQVSDLFWLSSFWHPTVRAIRMPIRWTTGAPEPVQERGSLLLKEPLARMDRLLCSQPWWYGDRWSICDVYFCWICGIAEGGGYPLDGMSGISAHRQRTMAHPAFKQAIHREQAALARARA